MALCSLKGVAELQEGALIGTTIVSAAHPRARHLPDGGVARGTGLLLALAVVALRGTSHRAPSLRGMTR
jgi:hypothetical protein